LEMRTSWPKGFQGKGSPELWGDTRGASPFGEPFMGDGQAGSNPFRRAIKIKMIFFDLIER